MNRIKSAITFLFRRRDHIAPPTMTSTDRTSLSAEISTPATRSTASKLLPENIANPPKLIVGASQRPPPSVQSLAIKVEDSQNGTVPAFLHMPTPSDGDTTSRPHSRTAAILLSGAGGGVVGPSSIYLSLASKLPALAAGIPIMRLDYRFPARNIYCVADTLAAMEYLQEKHKIETFVLVGWSFGGAPVFTVGGRDRRVIGCATVASQTAETEPIREAGRRGVPVLLLHGTGDHTLSPTCSEQLYAMHNGRHRTLRLFDGDDHALTQNAKEAEKEIAEFILRCTGERSEAGEVSAMLAADLVGGKDQRIEQMRKGGDLRGPENVE